MNDSLNKGGIIGWFARNPVAANLLMLLIIVLGMLTVGDLRKEAFPAMKPDSINIAVTYDSGSATQSEEGLAIKIEDALEDVIGIKSITSTANGSGANVSVEMQAGYDLDTLMRDVKAEVDAISNFPSEADNPVITKAQRESDALSLQLHGDADRYTLQSLADALRSDLLSKPDISQVNLNGWLDPMMSIEVNEARLQAYGLALSDVQEAINQNSSSTSTAVLRNDNLYLQLKASEQAYLQQDFAALPLINDSSGRQLLLGDVANIRDTYDDNTAVLSRFANEPSIGLEVVSTGQDDIINTVTATLEVVDQWRADGRLPQGVELTSWQDSSESITDRLRLLVSNAGMGIVLVFVLLALFLNVRVAFWVAMGLPFIFFGTLFFMGENYAGLSLNEFTTFGFIMALGIVVDDAVVVGESVYAVRAAEGDTLANTIKGTLRVAVPTLFGVFTTVVAFFALSQISGRMGQLYAQFATVVTICLVLSIIESKLILPAHLAHLKTHRQQSGNVFSRGWQWLQKHADGGLNWVNQRLYRPMIDFALTHRYAVIVLFVSLFLLVMAMPFNGSVRMSFFPEIPGDQVSAHVSMLNDASYGQTHAALTQLEQQAYVLDRELSGAADSDGGIAHLQVLSASDQEGQVTVELADDATYDIVTFTRRWRTMAGNPEGVKTINIQSQQSSIDALRIELRANDDSILTQAGSQLKKQLQAIPAVNGISDNLTPGQPQLHLTLTQQGRALGMTTDQLATQLYQAFSGQVVQRYQRNSDEIEVKVRYPEGDRQNPANVLNARVRTPDGAVVPLSSVASVQYGFTRDSITRIDGKRAVYLAADVDKEQLSATELVERLRATVVPELTRQYPGLDIQFAGEAEEQAQTQSSMLNVFLIAMLAIYMLLAIPLRSYIQPLLIMTAIPFGVVGAVLGHWFNDLSLGILSLNGIIALSGVVVNDSLLLVARYNDIKQTAGSLTEAISEACRSRLRAVLLTSATTFVGLMPLLGETSRQAQFLIPAAVSLAYGILFATAITLILIPSLLLIQEDARGWLGRHFKGPATAEDKPTSC